MTGLESIIEEIEATAKEIASKNDDETSKRIDYLINEANKKAAEILILARDKAEREEKIMLESAEGFMELKRNKELLENKQNLIRLVIEKAKEEIKSKDKDSYFSFLTKLLDKNSLGIKGELVISDKDIKSMPTSFLKKVKKHDLEIKKGELDERSGFMLIYGDVEVSCLIDDVFFDKKEKIFDMLKNFLFSAEGK